MFNLLKPKIYIESIFVLNVEDLKKRKIRGVILDIDNTLIEWNRSYVNTKVRNWLEELKKEGFKLCLVSNNTQNRVVVFNETLKLLAIHRAAKPRVAPFRKAMKLMGTTPDTTAVIGDQLFTDILGGNRLNLFTILVVPLDSQEFFWTKFVRRIERFVLCHLFKQDK